MKKKLLVLDLDETLIHANEVSIGRKPDFDIGDYIVYKRPGVNEFVEYCFEHFDVAIWTSSNRLYADAIVNFLIPDPSKLQFVWARERCTQRFIAETYEYTHLKVFKKLKDQGYSLDLIIGIDDSPEKYVRNYGNLVKVNPYFGEETDNELSLLTRYLEILKQVPNVRKIEKRNWRGQFA